jgi:PAS domain S-box-containing protein
MGLFSSGDRKGTLGRAIAMHYAIAIAAASLVILLANYVGGSSPWLILLSVIPASVAVAALFGTGPGLLCMVIIAAGLGLPGILERQPDVSHASFGVLAASVLLTLPGIGLVDSIKRRSARNERDQRPQRLPLPEPRHRSDLAATIVPSTALELATDLQRRLDERIRADARLAAEHSVTRILAHADNFEDAAPLILQAICANLGFEIGEVWLKDASIGQLQCCEIFAEDMSRFESFVSRSRACEIVMGAGLPGRVWESRTPIWIENVAEDSNFPRADVALEAGLNSGCAFPIISGERFIGVMAFFSSQSLDSDQDMMNSMAVVGSEIGQFIMRKQAERDLHEKHLQLQSVNSELNAMHHELRAQNENLIAARNALESERQRYHELFQFAPDGYVVTDLDGNILEANHSAAVQLNAPPSLLVGENALDYIDASQIDAVQARMRAVRDGVVSRQALDFRLMPFDAPPINAAVTLASMRDSDGQPVGYRWLIRDVGHWRQIEGELAQHRERLEELIETRTAELEATHERLRFSERMASIGTLATGLGHDIGNFVLPVLCRLDTLSEQPLPKETLGEIDQIRQSVLGLRNLSKGLSLFALDPEDAGTAPRSTSFESWWADAGPLLRKAVPKNVELRCEFEPLLPKVAIAPHQLTQTVRNLLTNAGEACSDSGVVLLSVARSSDQHRVLLRVTDNGVGMSEEVRQHAFEPFFTTKKRSLSTGLGLSVVHAVAKTIGGAVEIESKPSQGTTVTMALPAIVEAPPSASLHSPSRGVAITLSDDRLGSYAAALLKSGGIAVRHAEAPTDEALWITDVCEGRLEQIKGFLEGQKDRRVLLVGPATEEWNQPGILVAEQSHRAMHQALQTAVLDLF